VNQTAKKKKWFPHHSQETKVTTAMIIQQILTYGDNRSPIRANFQNMPKKMFLSFLESTIPGTVWRTYVHVQINRRMTRSRASKWKRADIVAMTILMWERDSKYW